MRWYCVSAFAASDLKKFTLFLLSVIVIFTSSSRKARSDGEGSDPAGNVWAANNWNDLNAAAAPDPLRATSTWGGGSGFTVIYGVAAPVKPPRMGKVQPY